MYQVKSPLKVCVSFPKEAKITEVAFSLLTPSDDWFPIVTNKPEARDVVMVD